MQRRSFLKNISACAAAVRLRANESDSRASEFEQRIFDRVNELRRQSGSPELDWMDSIHVAAQEQSARKAQLRFPGHVDPQFGDIAQRLTARGLTWSTCGENLFVEKGYDDPVNLAVVCWWYSEGHRRNLLNPDYSQSAVGIAIDPDHRIFATQIFLRPPLTVVRRQKSPVDQRHRAHKPEIFEKLFRRN
jgi:uncharacterized protein YkwD